MEYIPGHVYFVKDDFFDLVQDPYLMKNYPETKRPHYYAIQDRKTGLFWRIPCSSKVDKYKRIIARQKKSGHAVTTIRIETIAGRMLTAREDYIKRMALRGHSFFVGCFSGEIEKGPGGASRPVRRFIQ